MNSELMKVVVEMRDKAEEAHFHGDLLLAKWLKVSADRLEAIAKALGEQPDLTAITVRLCAPTDSEPFRQLDCRVVDIGYADRALIVECEEAIRYPAADVLDGMVFVGELVEMPDDLGTIFCEWTEAKAALPAGTKLFAATTSPENDK